MESVTGDTKILAHSIISSDLKLALMHYYRFNYGFICAEECANADILVDTGTEIIEVEVKISKQDFYNSSTSMTIPKGRQS